MSELRPSKQFIKRGSIAIGIIVVILAVQTKWVQNLFNRNPKTNSPKVKTVGDIVNQDSNGNGIPDWEEKLWGLDPTILYTNGVSNEQIINSKKKNLGIQNATGESLDDTDRLARELFTLTAALGQSEEIDSQTLAAISAKLASSLNIKQVNNQYSLKDIQTVQTSTSSLNTYYASMKKVISKYDTNTADIEVLVNALQNDGVGDLSVLKESAVIYQKLAKELLTLKVPLGLSRDHLALVNSFSGIGTSFTFMTELSDNSLLSLVGIAVYKNYSAKLSGAIFNMDEYFNSYGIINS